MSYRNYGGFAGRNEILIKVPVSLLPNEAKSIFRLPEPGGVSTTYFLDLKLYDANGSPKSLNFYCLSTKPDVLDWAKTLWYMTPLKGFADFTSLNRLPEVELNVRHLFSAEGQATKVEVELKNSTSHLAFQIELMVLKYKKLESVLPIFWEDNYVSLLPGEKRIIRGWFATEDLGGENPVLKVSGWNVKNSLLF